MCIFSPPIIGARAVFSGVRDHKALLVFSGSGPLATLAQRARAKRRLRLAEAAAHRPRMPASSFDQMLLGRSLWLIVGRATLTGRSSRGARSRSRQSLRAVGSAASAISIALRLGQPRRAAARLAQQSHIGRPSAAAGRRQSGTLLCPVASRNPVPDRRRLGLGMVRLRQHKAPAAAAARSPPRGPQAARQRPVRRCRW